jgi:hypothetical protein
VNDTPIILDGYGLPFDPARHLAFVRAAKGDESFALRVPDVPCYESPKDKPAGHYDRSDKMETAP